ncbi:RsiV family protein [Aquimarina agarivorans]|uniref:RsiV family protein n=1 Tax=Aquimarina agarivorans TaxID=980584 RepID=UPI0034DADCFF
MFGRERKYKHNLYWSNYFCWSLSEDNFIKNKDNFTISDSAVKFYFNECTICPQFTGEYAIEIPLAEIKTFILYKNILKS